MDKLKISLLLLFSPLIAIIVIGSIGYILIENDPEWKTDIEKRLEEDRIKEEALQKEKDRLEIIEREQQKKLKVPSSCNNVHTIEVDLYGKQCLSDINKGIEKWCEDKSENCVKQVYYKVAEHCVDTIMGSEEMCMMKTLKHIYPQLMEDIYGR